MTGLGDFGRITADEQVDALRTLIAVFATAVQRPGHPARNAVTVEILDILDETPIDRVEPVAQLFTMMAMRLRRRIRSRSRIFRQTIETALLARSCHGAKIPEDEKSYLEAERPSLGAIESACGALLERLDAVEDKERYAWLTAEAIAAALIRAESERRLGGPDRDAGDLVVAEFLLKTAAQYLAATAKRGP